MKINCNGVNYNVEICGQGEPLLLLHGFSGNSTTWNEVTESLGKNYMCILPDLIGHGRSDSPETANRYDVKHIVDDLAYILDVLQITKVHVLGYSMGGRIDLAFAILHEKYVNTLLLESSSPGLQSEEERRKRIVQDGKLAEKILKDGVPAFVAYWENIPLFESQKSLPIARKQQIHNQRLDNVAIGLANSLYGVGTGIQPSWWRHLEKLSMPVLLMTGEYDQKFCQTAQKMKKKINKCEWHVIPKVGHAIHVEDSEMFGRIVSEFLEKWRV